MPTAALVIAATFTTLAFATVIAIDHTTRRIAALERLTVTSTNTIQAVIDNLTNQLVKAQREITARIADVQTQLDAVGAAQVDLTALTAAAQALDDIVPDPPQIELATTDGTVLATLDINPDTPADTEPA